MDKPLSQKNCLPCEVKVPPLRPDQIEPLRQQIGNNWQLVDDQKLRQQFKFKDFQQSMKFVNQVADIAEAEGHHPDIYIYYNKVVLELQTHFIGGLHQNDFILASKIDLVNPSQ